MKTVKNFARFFAILKGIPGADEALKEEYVGSFTGGRTTSLREMTPEQYNTMCDTLERRVIGNDYIVELRRQRAAVLKRITKLGIDTQDYEKVDRFCQNPRIAGKLFRQLNIDDLRALIPKLEAIARKDVTRSKKVTIEESPDNSRMILIHLDDMVRIASNQIPS